MVCSVYILIWGVRCGVFCIYPDMGVRCGLWYVLYVS